MLQVFRTPHRIRRCTKRIGEIASSCAILLSMCILTIAHASLYCPGGTCGGINVGVNVAASNITGVTRNTPAQTIQNIITAMRNYVTILAVAVIVIAGFYLILGLGNETSKETARKTILYTAIGIVIINVAQTIVHFFMGIHTGTASVAIISTIQRILYAVTSYVGILAVAVIVIAGFYLILGFGNETSKETARKTIIYTAVGILVIALADTIVAFFRSFTDPTITTNVRGNIRHLLLSIINFAGLFAVAVIVIAGIMLTLSFGDEGRKDTAKKAIIYAIVGLIVIALSSAFVRLVANIF